MEQEVIHPEHVPSFPLSGVFYHWPRGFLLTTPHFVLDRGDHPTRRPSIRLMYARRREFNIEFSDRTWLPAQAVLMGPNVQRRQMIARDADFVLLDVAVSTPEYAVLEPLIAKQDVVTIDVKLLEPLEPALARAADGSLSVDELKQLRRQIVYAVTGCWPAEPDCDHRVETAIAIIHQQPLESVSLHMLAQSVHLSPGRLRHLFKQQVGCAVSHYARTAAVWRALTLWSQGEQLTNIAHEVGFHDYAHFYHAFNDMFGFSPSIFSRGAALKMIRVA